MKNFLIAVISLFFLLFSSDGFSQAEKNVEFKKENFQGKEKEFHQAIKALNKANNLMEQGKTKYREALSNYLKVYDFNPNNTSLNYKIGFCYLNTIQKTKSLSFLEKVEKMDSTLPQLSFLLGKAYHLNMQWDKAIQKYTAYRSSLSVLQIREGDEKEVMKKIEECKVGKKLTAHPVKVRIEPIDSVNSSYTDYGPVISADESILMFTSRRDNATGGKIDDALGEYYEDIYVSYKTANGWSKAVNIGPPINTPEHDATVALSPDGQTLYIYKDKGNGNIYECKLKGDKWSKPAKMSGAINTKHHESSACISPDGNTLYFVSDKPGGLGGRDIYYCKLNKEKKRWNKAVNIGSVINTEYDEEGVFMHPDGKTLYFSSQGHESMGGFDLFKSVWNDSAQQWSQPENLGYPINTPDDDDFFVLSANGKHGYYSSFQPNGVGGRDLYTITFLGTFKLFLLNQNKEVIASAERDADGFFVFESLPSDENILFKAEGEDTNLKELKIKIGNTKIKSEKEADGYFHLVKPVVKHKLCIVNREGKLIATAEKDAEGYFVFETLPSDENVLFKMEGEDTDLKEVKIKVGTTKAKTVKGEDGYFHFTKPEIKSKLCILNREGKLIACAEQDADNAFVFESLPPDENVLFKIEGDDPGLKELKVVFGMTKMAVKKGNDNYFRVDYAALKVEATKSGQLTILKGIIRDALTQQPIEATIELSDNKKNEVISSFQSNSKTGKYLVSLPSGKNYGIAVKADGYLFHSENIDFPATTEYHEIVKDIKLGKIEVGNKIILKNIFFDFDKVSLRAESTSELERLIQLMKEKSTLRIEISGHTDNVGTNDYNQKLSEDRAKAVVDYLTKHGIDKSRLQYKGYGMTQPLESNDSVEGRQINRRTEFKVTEK